MRIALGLKEVLVHVEHDSMNYKIIKQYVEKNFTNTLTFSSTILIFNNEAEKYKRQFFLQWLYASYKKVNPDLMPSFKANLLKRIQQPIKIRVTDKKEMMNKYVLSIQVLDERIMTLRLEVKNYLLLNYLKLTFRKETIKRSDDGQTLYLRLDTPELRRKIAEFIGRRKLLNYATAFEYDEIAMNAFLHPKEQERSRYQVQVYKDSFVRSSYALLDSSPEDPIEEIKRRYIRLVKKFHPDRFFHESSAKVAEYTEKFQKVQRAYEAVKKDKKGLLPFAR